MKEQKTIEQSGDLPANNSNTQHVNSVHGVNAQIIGGSVTCITKDMLNQLKSFAGFLNIFLKIIFLILYTFLNGESGMCSIGGRPTHYQVKGKFHFPFIWGYHAKLMDMATQEKGFTTDYFFSKNGALTFALTELAKKLKKRNISWGDPSSE